MLNVSQVEVISSKKYLETQIDSMVGDTNDSLSSSKTKSIKDAEAQLPTNVMQIFQDLIEERIRYV